MFSLQLTVFELGRPGSFSLVDQFSQLITMQAVEIVASDDLLVVSCVKRAR
jgi:hypothetical protein